MYDYQFYKRYFFLNLEIINAIHIYLILVLSKYNILPLFSNIRKGILKIDNMKLNTNVVYILHKTVVNPIFKKIILCLPSNFVCTKVKTLCFENQ